MQALGSAPCIDALRLDVATIQKIAIEVISRVGSVPNVQSWKFTNQNASEVDITRLLQRYKHNPNSSTAETNAIVHVVLLELVIDRLLFLIQAVERHLASNLSSLTIESIAKDAKLLNSPLSNKYKSQIAAATQQFWTRIMSTTSALQTLDAAKTSTSNENEITLPSSPSSGSQLRKAPELNDADTQTDGDSSALFTTRPKTAISCSCAAQTSEIMQPVAKEMASLCRLLGLASNCNLQRPASSVLSSQSPISLADLKRTQAEMVIDFQNVSKSVKELQQRVANLQECKQRAEELRAELDHARCEIDEQRHDYNKKLNDLSGRLQQTTKLRDDLQKQLKQKTQAVEGREMALSRITNMLQSARQLDGGSDSVVESDAEDAVESRLGLLIGELNNLRNEQLELQQQVCVEQVRCRSLQQQNSALIHKQQTLLTQYELLEIEKQTLSTELEKRICDALSSQKRVEVEEQQQQRQQNESVRKSEQRIAELEAEVRQLAARESAHAERNAVEVAAVQTDLHRAQVTIRELEEKLALLVQYPDVVTNDMIEISRRSARGNETEIEDDVTSAMQRQLEANTVRIELLQRENSKLSRTVSKLALASNSVAASIQANKLNSSQRMFDIDVKSASASASASAKTVNLGSSGESSRRPASGLRRDETELNLIEQDERVSNRLPAVSGRRDDAFFQSARVDVDTTRSGAGNGTPVIQLWSMTTPTSSSVTSRQNTITADEIASIRGVGVESAPTAAAESAKMPPRMPDRTRTYRVSSAVAMNRGGNSANAPARPTTTAAAEGAARQFAGLNDIVIGPGKHARKSSARSSNLHPSLRQQ